VHAIKGYQASAFSCFLTNTKTQVFSRKYENLQETHKKAYRHIKEHIFIQEITGIKKPAVSTLKLRSVLLRRVFATVSRLQHSDKLSIRQI
jgi:CRISPR/Cas system-associated endoribonuclease Cas2